MLNRLVSSFVIVSLLAASAAAGQFAQPPPADAGAVPATEPAPPAVAPAPMPDEIRPPEVVVTRAAVRAALAKRRANSIELFRAYWRAGVYPHNTFTDEGTLNVWLDAEGHLCAAASMISWSGFYSQVMQQAAEDNFIRLVDVDDGWLLDWMLVSGLTQEELVAIQLPFSPVREIDEKPGRQIVLKPDPERVAVDRRLRKGYVKVDRMLIRNTRRSLDRAVERLMQRPELARQLLVEGDRPSMNPS